LLSEKIIQKMIAASCNQTAA